MAFALESTDRIRQTGTDTSLAGSAAISGVSQQTSAGGHSSYRWADRQLLVAGTLTIDPEVEALIQDDNSDTPAIRVLSGGTLNIGQRVLLNSAYRYSNGTAIRMENTSTNAAWDSAALGLRVESGGTLNWYGGTIFTRSGIEFQVGSTVRIYSEFAVMDAYADSGGQQAQVRQRESSLVVDGLTLNRAVFTLIAIPSTLQGLRAFHCPIVYDFSLSTPAELFVPIRDLDASGGNTVDIAFWHLSRARSINAVSGSDANCTGHQPDGGTNSEFNTGLAEHRHEIVAVSSRDAATGSAIAGFGIYFRSRDHGNRLAQTTVTVGEGGSRDTPDYTNVGNYGAMEASGSCTITTDGGILLGVDYNVTGGARGIGDEFDSHGEANDRTDAWNMRARVYGYNFQTLPLVLKGRGGYSGTAEFRSNPDITESSGVAAAHTGITLVDHGGSPVSWQGKSWGITVLCNLTTNSGLTASNLYHYLQYHLAQTTTSFNGKDGGEWHNMLRPFQSGYQTETGTYGTLRAVKGVRVITGSDASSTSADPMPGLVRMQADDGTYYEPPVAVQLTITALDSSQNPVEGAAVYAEAGSGGSETQGDVVLNGLTNASGIFTASFTYTVDQPLQNGWVRSGSSAIPYEEADVAGTITSSGFSATITLRED